VLTIHTSNPARDIQIGDATGADLLHLGYDDLGNIRDGFGQIVIGNGASGVGQDIRLIGVQQGLVFHDPLMLDAPNSGSLIHLEGSLTAPTLDARGATEIAGTVTIDAAGILFERSLNGVGTGQVNRLVLNAQGGDVHLAGVVGGSAALSGLDIATAGNVAFDQAVTLDGNLTIHDTGTVHFNQALALTHGNLDIDSSGDVRFDQAVTLNGGDIVIHTSGVVRFDAPLDLHGGHLTIIGASQVILGGGTIGGGEIHANAIQVQGALHGGNLALHGNDPAGNINLGGPDIAGALNLSVASLANLSGLSGLVIGERGADGHTAVGAGNVSIAAVDLSALHVAVEVHGNAITLAANPAGELRLANGMSLEALSDITLNDSITTAAGDLHLASLGGDIVMAAGSHISGQGDAVELRASGDLVVAGIDAQGNTQGGRIVLQSLNGHILDADHDSAANLRAAEVVMRGLGAEQGVVGENVLEVQASRVSIEPDGGVVFQDVTPDGSIHYNLMRGGLLYEQLVNLGDAVRVTTPSDPSGDQFAGGYTNHLPPSSFANAGQVFGAGLHGYPAAGDSPRTAAYLAGNATVVHLASASSLLSAQSFGLGSQAYAPLGTPGLQLWSTGEAANDEEAFDYWTESLAL
jgi:hypothetical protein